MRDSKRTRALPVTRRRSKRHSCYMRGQIDHQIHRHAHDDDDDDDDDVDD